MSSLSHTSVKPASRLQSCRLVIFTQRRRDSPPQSNSRVLSSFSQLLPSGDFVAEGTGRDAKLSGGFGFIAVETSDS